MRLMSWLLGNRKRAGGADDGPTTVKDGRERLTAVFERTRTLLALPGNDFVWSGWDSQVDALRVIDDMLDTLRKGGRPDPAQMKLLFAATGRIQEVSIDGGWADEFIELSNQFDQAFAEFTGLPA